MRGGVSLVVYEVENVVPYQTKGTERRTWKRCVYEGFLAQDNQVLRLLTRIGSDCRNRKSPLPYGDTVK